MSKKDKKEGFMAFDDFDEMIMIRLRNKSEDFRMLDELDQKVLVWSLCHHPRRVESWIDYITGEYKRIKHVDINKSSLMNLLGEMLE